MDVAGGNVGVGVRVGRVSTGATPGWQAVRTSKVSEAAQTARNLFFNTIALPFNAQLLFEPDSPDGLDVRGLPGNPQGLQFPLRQD